MSLIGYHPQEILPYKNDGGASRTKPALVKRNEDAGYKAIRSKISATSHMGVVLVRLQLFHLEQSNVWKISPSRFLDFFILSDFVF